MAAKKIDIDEEGETTKYNLIGYSTLTPPLT